MAALDALICQDWEYRYHFYNSQWAEGEAFFELRNGEGDQLLILFREEGAVINGLAAGAAALDRVQLATELPAVFHEFMFGEPVLSAGTTFCVWQTGTSEWTARGPAEAEGPDTNPADRYAGFAELLSPLDGQAATYADWAEVYFRGLYPEPLNRDAISCIYRQEPLTAALVSSLALAIEDPELLQQDLEEISYPYHLNS